MHLFTQRASNKPHFPFTAAEHKEKLTCLSVDEKVYGGFLGGIYKIPETTEKIELIGTIDSPVSFLARAIYPSKGNSAKKEEIPAEYIIGDWDGNIYIDKKKLKVSASSYPIKYVLPTEYGIVVCDTVQMYLVQESVVSSLYIGTWPLFMQIKNNKVTVTTAYTVHSISIEESRLKEKTKRELLRDATHTETITCIENTHRYIGGSIGGWIIKLEDAEDAESCNLTKVMKVAENRLTGILLYRAADKQYYICSSQNEIYIVDAKDKKVVHTIEITKDNGIFSIKYKNAASPAIFIFDRNFKVYSLDLSRAFFSGKENKEPEGILETSKTADTYEDLLKELNAGLFD